MTQRYTPLRHAFALLLAATLILGGLTACSSTSSLREGEVLYAGIKHIHYPTQAATDTTDAATRAQQGGALLAIGRAATHVSELLTTGQATPPIPTPHGDSAALHKQAREAQKIQARKDNEALSTAKTEVESALAYAPNGALFGSSSIRNPFPISLWIYNAFADEHTGVGGWIKRNFGSEPILITHVNPDVRSRVATNTLHNYGYFRGKVQHELFPNTNGKQAHIGYTVTTGALFRLDSIAYRGFTPHQDSLLQTTTHESHLRHGEGFSALKLNNERSRLETLFRNNGYYYYKAAHITYEADTLIRPEWVQLRARPTAAIPPQANRQWHIGNIAIQMLRDEHDQLTDSAHSRNGYITYHFGTRIMPVRPFVWRQALTFKKGDRYTLTDYRTSLEKLKLANVFSILDIEYTPRDTTTDTLDVRIFAILDKPYTGAFEIGAKYKNSRQIGPSASFTLSKINSFRAGETVNFKIFGSYEWQLSSSGIHQNSTTFNSYELGAETSISFPRFLFPWLEPRMRRHTAKTTFATSIDWLKRSSYYSMVDIGARIDYQWHTRDGQHRHTLSPFSLDYYSLLSHTTTFDSIMTANPTLRASMTDQFVPAISYTYFTQSRPNARNTRSLQLTFKEAGLLFSGFHAATGSHFNTVGKRILGAPFAQFIKATAEYRQNFKLNASLRLATRAFIGAAYAYGNARSIPYAEQFYAGGANSIRGFAARSIGPGSYQSPNTRYAYIDQTGDVKLELNAELRFPIMSALYGALFIDAGNVWLLRNDPTRPGSKFTASNLRHIAVGTGAGLRYDLDFLVLRLDLGAGLHAPYHTGRSGFYNMPSFTKSLTLNFAIGYPF